jgi:hypothetical protein
VENPDLSRAKERIAGDHSIARAQQDGPTQRKPTSAANANSSKRRRHRSDRKSPRGTRRPADFAARIDKLQATIQSTWISRGFSPQERLVLQDLISRLAELLGEDIDA